MRIAVASSGLGHVARGIETWAADTADALHGAGVNVTLFAAGPVSSAAPRVVVPCLRRRTGLNSLLVRLMPGPTWRWGLKDGYGWEQLTFWLRLRHHLTCGAYDILHVQDPMLAFWCRRARRAGRIAAKEILAHGTEEPLTFLSQFDYVQHLAPWHLEQSAQAVPPGGPERSWAAIPNFVDTQKFRPADSDDERAAARRQFGIPADAFVVGTAAAIKRHHKRIDHLIREFGIFRARACATPVGANAPREPFLVIAGSRQPDTPLLRALAEQVAPGRVLFLVDQPRDRMPALLRCYDVFALTSLFEMMPIALLEAIATGLPVLTNDHPVLAWMGGEGGMRIDMAAEGALAAALGALTPDQHARLARGARAHAVAAFSAHAVIQQYIAYYHTVLGTAPAGSLQGA